MRAYSGPPWEILAEEGRKSDDCRISARIDFIPDGNFFGKTDGKTPDRRTSALGAGGDDPDFEYYNPAAGESGISAASGACDGADDCMCGGIALVCVTA